MTEEGELKKEILKGKIGGDYKREMVDLSYVWSAIDEAKKDFMDNSKIINLVWERNNQGVLISRERFERWFGDLKKWFGDST